MGTEFKLPELGEGVETADVAEILVAEGDRIIAGQSVMELETEKAVVELPCQLAGTVTKIHVAQGDSIKVGQTLLTVEVSKDEGSAAAPEERPSSDKPEKSSDQVEAAADESHADEHETEAREVVGQTAAKEEGERRRERPAVASKDADRGPANKKGADGRPRRPVAAGPATRRLAQVLEIPIDQLQGSGPRGRITLEDVVRAHEARIAEGHAGRIALPKLPDFSKDGEIEFVPLNKIAQATVENLTRSWQLIPHVTQQGLADVTEVEAVRQDYNRRAPERSPKVTMTAIAVKACVAVLREFPHFNASIDVDGKRLILKKYFHIGIAVDTEHGLLVPVIRDADRKDIADIAAEIQQLVESAKNRKLDLKAMQGATFTISNQGSIGGTAFSPIVNWPQVAILGMSRASKQFVVVNDKPQICLILPLSLSYDHRAVNGAAAARFVVRLGEILSDSRKLLFEA